VISRSVQERQACEFDAAGPLSAARIVHVVSRDKMGLSPDTVQAAEARTFSRSISFNVSSG